uniref:Uncharacterized protein n=1 Tax=Oncorhynchus tshawytscha TaxID=74940 RepID=A0AAZ3QC59_ONCTS
MNGLKYREILDENMLQSTQDLRLGRRFTLQQDNDLKHTAKTMQDWLWDKSLNVLEWHRQSLESTISGETWIYLCGDAPHPTWQSLRGSTEKNWNNSPNTGVPSL